MRGVGMDLPYRQRFQFLLELIYGDTFKPKAFWARHPDPDEFFYALFRVAKPDLPRTAFVGDVFELSAETLHNEVNALALGRLGVSSEQLLRLFQHNAAVEQQAAERVEAERRLRNALAQEQEWEREQERSDDPRRRINRFPDLWSGELGGEALAGEEQEQRAKSRELAAGTGAERRSTTTE